MKLKQAFEKFFSVRTYYKILKILKTIADLEFEQKIKDHQVAEVF